MHELQQGAPFRGAPDRRRYHNRDERPAVSPSNTTASVSPPPTSRPSSATCEPLHGHNYDLIVEVEGRPPDDSWVWDFGALKAQTRALTEELDHKFLLQRESRVLTIVERQDAWDVSFEETRYVFPKCGRGGATHR